MTVKIVLPENKVEHSLKSTQGIRVFTDSGHEIKDISRIQCDWKPNSVIDATITVAVSEIENLEGVEGIILPEPEE